MFVRFIGAEGQYQSIETQAVRIHRSIERWGSGRMQSRLSLLPQDFFQRGGILRRLPRRRIEALVEGMDVVVVVKSSLFRGIIESAPLLESICRARGAVLVSNPCDGPGADSGDTRDVFSEKIAGYAVAVSRLQAEAISATRPAEQVFLAGHASRLETANRLVPRDVVRRLIWENPIHHNPRYDPRKVGMPRERYQELEDLLRSVLVARGAELVFIDAWRETQPYEEWERMMLASDIAVECKAMGASYVDYQAQKPAVKVLNYMSLGLPVVCDSLPAYRELGEDGKELLFANTLEEWTSQVTRLLDDASLRRTLGEAAHEAARPFGIEAVARRYMDFFERIKGKAPRDTAGRGDAR
jgi:hypothetical protein